MSRITHFELPADNPEKAIAFYERAFGWIVEKWEGPMEYWLIRTGDPDKPGIDGGMARRQDTDTGLELTIDVDDLDESCAAVEAHGGSIIRPRSAVPSVGWLAYCKDTEGNVFGLMQEDREAK